MTSSEMLNRIEAIFHAAVELAADERARFVDEQCGGDKELRKEVEALLEYDGREDEFIDGPPAALAAELLAGRGSADAYIGRSVGHYRILGLLGVGGMGEVYLADDTRLGRKVALKMLPRAFARDSVRMERFELEARSASALNHPNILTIHEIGEAEGIRFIATEYIDGKTLREVMSGGRLSPEAALDIAIQIASALDEAHSAGIVHRDIKPDNVMVRPNGLVKVLDFGVAKLLGTGAANGGLMGSRLSGKTVPGMIIGTADYMSPEQAKGNTVDRRSDIFSFGVLLYEMLGGCKAFSGENALDTIGAILHKTPSSLTASVPQLPVAIEKIIFRALEKRPEDRYQEIAGIFVDLKAEKRKLELTQPAAASLPQTPSADLIASARNERPTAEYIPTRSVADAPATGTSDDVRQGWQFRSMTARRIAAVSAIVVLVAVLGGFVGYRYMSASNKIDSIAVMPIINATGDAGNDYLSDGLTENLIRSLSSIAGLSMKARSTVFTYKGKEVPPRTIGRELNVDAVLLGRMEDAGDEVRLSLELVDAVTEDVVWTASYARRMEDLSGLQRDIARDVSDRLRPSLTPAEQRRVAKNYSADSEAQQLYLKGRFHWNKRNMRDFERAVRYFTRAVEIDPNYALAFTGLADTFALMPLYGNFSPTEKIPRAKDAAQKALQIDPNLAEAHASLGYIAYTFDHDWETAEKEYKTAIRLNPNYATARQWYAEHLAFRGRMDEALTEITTAQELDPFSMVINRMKGNILSFSKRHDEAIAQLNRTVELYPESAAVRFNLAEAFAAKGMQAEAIEQYLAGLKLSGVRNADLRRYENGYKLKGWQGFWMEHLATLITTQRALARVEGGKFYNNEGMAYAYAAVKNNEKAIEYLNLAYEAREPKLITITTSEVYEPLRYDPRYRELIEKIGLAE